VLFDWGDTLMRVFPDCPGPMADWPVVELLPGVRRALTSLRGAVLLGVATNAADSRPADIRRALRRARISSLLPRIYCFRSIGYRKSEPEFWQAVLADLQLPPEAVAMVGDDLEADVLAAVRSGLRAVWLNRRGTEVREGAAMRTIRDMAALPGELQAASWL
jgi:FMN phosphatase YigB (HAD superfamily)